MDVKIVKYLKLAASLIICLSAGAIGSVFTSSSVDSWYRMLNKPPFNPPSWLFAPVWTALYIMMGISLFLVWSRKSTKAGKKNIALSFFAVQLFLNMLWSALFFGLQNPLLAFVEIILLWIAIIITIALFRKISATAAYLLVPYLLWVTFASILNYSIFLLNL
jgi:translocator protein